MLRPDLGRTANLERSIHLLDDALGTPAQTSGKTNMTRLVIDDNGDVDYVAVADGPGDGDDVS